MKQSELLFTISSVLQGRAVNQARPALITRHAIRESNRRLGILLAEDNAINQKLAVKMLERMGHTVTVAKNGIEALELHNRVSFDLILMDIQMPEMDGLEATRTVRKREEITGKHVPVIAMTAYTMEGDKTRCLEAGMDGYISKPITAQALYEIIEQVMRRREKHVNQVQASIASPKPLVLNKTTILDRVGGDLELLRDIIKLFLEDYPKLVAEIREAFQMGDSERLAKATHTLKGSVSNFAAEAAVQAALKVENIARSGDLTDATQAIVHLEREIERVSDELGTLGKEIQT